MFEMSEIQNDLFNQLTPLQKEIALNVISGMNNIDAYKASKGKAKSEKAKEVSASQILGNLRVKAFIDSMANHIVNPAIMSRDEMMEELSLIARTNSSDLIEWGYRSVETVNKDSGATEVVQQSYWSLRPVDEINPDHMNAIEEVSVGKDGLKFKRTSKLAAMKQLADLSGYEAPKKTISTSVITKADDAEW